MTSVPAVGAGPKRARPYHSLLGRLGKVAHLYSNLGAFVLCCVILLSKNYGRRVQNPAFKVSSMLRTPPRPWSSDSSAGISGFFSYYSESWCPGPWASLSRQSGFLVWSYVRSVFVDTILYKRL